MLERERIPLVPLSMSQMRGLSSDCTLCSDSDDFSKLVFCPRNIPFGNLSQAILGCSPVVT
jgi:hypothetical protein